MTEITNTMVRNPVSYFSCSFCLEKALDIDEWQPTVIQHLQLSRLRHKLAAIE